VQRWMNAEVDSPDGEGQANMQVHTPTHANDFIQGKSGSQSRNILLDSIGAVQHGYPHFHIITLLFILHSTLRITSEAWRYCSLLFYIYTTRSDDFVTPALLKAVRGGNVRSVSQLPFLSQTHFWKLAARLISRSL
jgi:hypothetical protein